LGLKWKMITPERAFLFREQTQSGFRTEIHLPERVFQAFQNRDLVGLKHFFQAPVASKYNYKPDLVKLLLNTKNDELALIFHQHISPYKYMSIEAFEICYKKDIDAIFAYLSNSSNSKELQYLPWNFAFNENEIFEKDEFKKILNIFDPFIKDYCDELNLFQENINLMNSSKEKINFLNTYLYSLNLELNESLSKISRLYLDFVEASELELSEYMHSLGASQIMSSWLLVSTILDEGMLFLFDAAMPDEYYEPLVSLPFIKRCPDEVINQAPTSKLETPLDAAIKYLHPIAERHLRARGAKTYVQVKVEAEQELAQVIQEIWG
jgi:hypothetical protein